MWFERDRLTKFRGLSSASMAASQSRSRRFDERRSPWLSRGSVGKLLLLSLLLLVGYRQVKSHFQQPQAILVLGGATDREVFAADFARQYPDLPIWISSGSNPEYSYWVFSEAGIDSERLHLDYRAIDTVTNFTTLVDDFKAQGISSIYVITSDYHMTRARIIGEIVLGSRGISFKPLTVPSEQSPESMDKSIRDAARSVLWIATGHTGSSLRRYLPTQSSSGGS